MTVRGFPPGMPETQARIIPKGNRIIDEKDQTGGAEL
jgi:hypothetical protein